MKKRTLWAVLLCLALTLSVLCSCSLSKGVVAEDVLYREDYDNGIVLYSKQASEVYDVEKVDGDVTSDRKIIRTVDESVETDAFDDFMDALDTSLTSVGGYYGSLRTTGNGYGDKSTRRAYLTAYVPADRLKEFVDTIGTNGCVTSHEEKASDVTEAYVDVASRITVLEAEEASLLSILSSTKTVSEMLEVRQKLSEVQQDLASLRAQKSSYDKRVAYSTVNMCVYEVDYVSETGEKPFLQEVGETFTESLDSVVTFFRGLGIVLFGGFPIILLIAAVGLGIFFIIRALHRKQEKRRLAKKQETKTE